MTRPQYCHPCGEKRIDVIATTTVDDLPMCRPCAGIARRALNAPELCRNGCGKPPHRGRCRRIVTPIPTRNEAQMNAIPLVLPTPAQPTKTVHEMVLRRLPANPLNAKVIKLADVPTTKPRKAPKGRVGQLWEMLENLAPGEAIEVKCASSKHVGNTARALRKLATFPIKERREQNTFWCWRDDESQETA